MPFDAAEVARQIENSKGNVQAEARTREDAVELAVRTYRQSDATEWDQRRQQAGQVRRWIAAPLTPLHMHPHNSPAQPDYCVVATDSSFIPSDKHRGAFCHLVNVGRVMIRYGDNLAAEVDNIPSHDTEPVIDSDEGMGTRLLGAQCALRELQELYEWARRYEAGVALLDGSLMQLVLVLSKDEQVQALMSEYYQTLRAFEEIEVPVVGYISQPASQMVMRAIRMLACEQEVPCERRPDFPCSCQSLWSIEDGDLFWELLSEGQRSPVFEPVFSYMVGQGAEYIKDTAFTYLATQYEVARLEFPYWVAEQNRLDDAIKATLSQCKLGKGYPNALLLAHQYAVLHNADREGYYYLLERAGLMRKPTEKAQGKRMIGQAI